MAIPNISLTIGVPGRQTYKSIHDIVWNNIPGLVVLTGLNGAGKSQLLEVLAYGLNGIPSPDQTFIKDVQINGQTIERGATAYLPSNTQFQEGPASGITSTRQLKINMHQQIVQNSHDLRNVTKRNRIEGELGVDLSRISAIDFSDMLSDDLLYLLNDVDLTHEMAHVFTNYRMRMAELLLNDRTKDEATQQLGLSPWQLIDAELVAVAFPYRTLPPTNPIHEPFSMRLVEVGTGRNIKPSDLSTGEKVILEVILWLFVSKKRKSFPKLFLMDEPDAHLHPQMTRQFLDVIDRVLVKRHDVRVIMTTHSPSTVALAPEAALYEMRRGSSEVRKCTREEALALLTAGIVTVSPSTKHVIVEDEDDIKFYSAIRAVLSDYGPRQDKKALASTPTILFLPASTGHGADKVGGGCTVVYKWVEKFDTDPLKNLFRGIVDKDLNNSDQDRVFVIGRYSIENYMLDPLNVYDLLIQADISISSCSLKIGDEHLIQSLEPSILQSIVDEITQKVSSSETALSSFPGTKAVTFTNGITLNYPKWMTDYRGHDLLPMFQRAWGGHTIIKPPSLFIAIQRVRMIPIELAVLLNGIQT